MNRSTLSVIFFGGLLSLFSVLTCHAQKLSPAIGVKAGMNFAGITHSEEVAEDESIYIGLSGGVFARLPVTGKVAIQPELLYTGRGGRTEWAIQEVLYSKEYCLQYIDMPVMVVLPVGDRAFIEVGPYASYLVNASLVTEPNVPVGGAVYLLNRSDFNRIDVGMAAGLGMEFNMLSLSVRYNYGLKNVAQSEMAESILDDGKNRFFQLAIGLRIL
ncbi:MAG: porin family protein [Cyclobacteriaceae bacterium]